MGARFAIKLTSLATELRTLKRGSERQETADQQHQGQYLKIDLAKIAYVEMSALFALGKEARCQVSH